MAEAGPTPTLKRKTPSKKKAPALDPLVPPPMDVDESCKLAVQDVQDLDSDIKAKVTIIITILTAVLSESSPH
jgi:hypothetical protein